MENLGTGQVAGEEVHMGVSRFNATEMGEDLVTVRKISKEQKCLQRVVAFLLSAIFLCV